MNNAAATIGATAIAADEPLLRVEDVAAKWKITVRHVHRIVAAGQLQAYALPGVRRSLRFRPSDIEPVPKPPRRPSVDATTPDPAAVAVASEPKRRKAASGAAQKPRRPSAARAA